MLWTLAAFGAPPSSASCAPCHTEIVEQWRSSRHAGAFTNAVFQASWSDWPNGWCLQCHAPEEAQQVEVLGHPARPGIAMQRLDTPTGDLHEEGVTCQTCHGAPDGRLRTARTPSPRGQAMHPLVEDPDLRSAALCARCHEFAFQRHTPRFPFTSGNEPAQATVSEWRLELGRCQDCHMAEHGHRFPGAHDPDFVRGAIRVEATREGSMLRIAMENHGAGHAFPTGDPFRRVEIRLCRVQDCSLSEPAVLVGRVLERTSTTWRTRTDTRIDAGSTRVFEVPVGNAVAFEVVYRFGERRFESGLAPSDVGYRLVRAPLPQED